MRRIFVAEIISAMQVGGEKKRRRSAGWREAAKYR